MSKGREKSAKPKPVVPLTIPEIATIKRIVIHTEIEIPKLIH